MFSRPRKHLLLYYEVYDPAAAVADPAGRRQAWHPPLDQRRIFSGKTRLREFAGRITELNARERKPPSSSWTYHSHRQARFYTCQVNVIDDAGGHFLFPRLALLIRKEGRFSRDARRKVRRENSQFASSPVIWVTASSRRFATVDYIWAIFHFTTASAPSSPRALRCVPPDCSAANGCGHSRRRRLVTLHGAPGTWISAASSRSSPPFF